MSVRAFCSTPGKTRETLVDASFCSITLYPAEITHPQQSRPLMPLSNVATPNGTPALTYLAYIVCHCTYPTDWLLSLLLSRPIISLPRIALSMAHVDLAYLEKTALHTFSFLLQPASWARFAYPNPLVWETVQFTKANRAHVPRKDGVYGFLVRFGSPWGTHPPAYLMYIGETGRTLWERYGEYLRESEGKGKTRPALSRMFQLFPDDLFFTYAVTPPGEAFSVEQQLIKAFWPPLNDQLPAELRPAQKALRR